MRWGRSPQSFQAQPAHPPTSSPPPCTQASPSEAALREAGAELEAVRRLLALLASRADVLVERGNGKADATAALGRALQKCASHDDVSGRGWGCGCDCLMVIS